MERQTPLEPYEEEVLIQMYNTRIIGESYKPIETIASIVKWDNIRRKYNIKKKFSKVLDRLYAKGYITYGKSRDVASLSGFGVAYAYRLSTSR